MTKFVVFTFLFSGIAITSCRTNNTKTEAFSTGQFYFAMNLSTDTATFGSGCFWCTEAVFRELKGVQKVTCGYSGGHVSKPTYEQVCEKNTGHAEVAQIIFDPKEISFDELLEVFWQVHDPTTLNRQGADVGPQYRSVIFYHNAGQKEKAEHYKSELDKSGAFTNPIVTAIEPLKNFYPAEGYHQNFYTNNPNYGYCTYVIKPKLDKFRKVFAQKLRKSQPTQQ